MSTIGALRRLQHSWWSLFQHTLPIELEVMLLAAYKEPHRHYHGQSHINDCIGKLFKFSHLFSRPHEACIAFWFHDVVYDPKRNDNEAQSAELARKWLMQSLSINTHEAEDDEVRQSIARVCELIMNTKDHQASTLDAQAFVDIDLSILSSSTAQFDRYQQQIRQEYAHVLPETYKAARHHFLLNMSCRPSLYQHPSLRPLWQHKANRNLSRALGQAIG